MAQRPTIKSPKPLASQPIPQRPGDKNTPAQVLGSLQSEISTEAAPLWNFVLNNSKYIAGAVVAVVVVVIGIGGWQWHQESSLNAFKLEFGRIAAIQNEQDRLADLENLTSSAPQEMYLAVQMEIARAAIAVEDWDKALAAYDDVIAKDGDTALALMARLNKSGVLHRQMKIDEALAELEALLPKFSGDVATRVQLQIAGLAEEAGQNQKAVEAYEKTIAALPTSEQAQIDYYKSRIARLQ